MPVWHPQPASRASYIVATRGGPSGSGRWPSRRPAAAPLPGWRPPIADLEHTALPRLLPLLLLPVPLLSLLLWPRRRRRRCAWPRKKLLLTWLSRRQQQGQQGTDRHLQHGGQVLHAHGHHAAPARRAPCRAPCCAPCRAPPHHHSTA